MKTKATTLSNVKGIRTSLKYLSIEAKCAGLADVAAMLERAAVKCNSQGKIENGKEDSLEKDEMVSAINFLYHFYKASKASQKLFLEYIDDTSVWLESQLREGQKAKIQEKKVTRHSKHAA